MNNRFWINLGLLGLIVLLSVIVIIGNSEKKQPNVRISEIDIQTIDRIQVFRADLGQLQFIKEGERWLLTQPKAFRANSARLFAMLELLNTKSYTTLKPDTVELEQLGLDKPAIQIKFNDHMFQFGTTDAIDQRRYVLFENRIHLVDDLLYRHLIRDFAFFADPQLVPTHFKINAIRYPDNLLQQIEDGWKLEHLRDISPDQLKRIPFNWQTVRAISIEPFPPQTEPLPMIKLSTIEGDKIEFILLATQPHLVLGRRDLQLKFHLGSDETRKLLLIETNDLNTVTETENLGAD